MPDKFILIAILTFLHDLFTAIWIGGLLTLGLTVFPAIKKVLGMGPQTVMLVDTIQKKLSKIVYVSIVGLFITGAMQGKMIPEFQGLLHFGNTYSLILGIKHILFLLMIIIAVLRSQIIGRNMKGPNPKIAKIKAVLLMLNMLLGVIVLLLSGFNSAIS
jgi:uncharacterized membrane protein